MLRNTQSSTTMQITISKAEADAAYYYLREAYNEIDAHLEEEEDSDGTIAAEHKALESLLDKLAKV